MKAKPKLSSKIGFSAIREVLPISGSFDLLISNSSDPSSTIRINPRVPNIGNTGFRFGSVTPKAATDKLTIQPRSSSIITEGIFVFAEVISNR